VTRIAHLSDVHLLEPRPSRDRSGYPVSVRYLSLGRPLDGDARKKKLARALAAVERLGADHVVLSGDLTENGSPGQFESLAESLADARLAPDRVTLVPGNHDLYASPTSWTDALSGPLAPYAASSATVPGKVVERDGVCFLPLDVARYQHFTRSGGELTQAWAEAVERRVKDSAFRSRPLVLVQHHPPFLRAPGVEWIDGLRGGHRLMELLTERLGLYAMHGHLHSIVDKAVKLGKSRIFGAPAVVDDEGVARLRLYEVRGGEVVSAGLVS